MPTSPSSGRFSGSRVLVTMADRYTGPAVVDMFRAEGATVTADTDSHRDPAGPDLAVAAAGDFDVSW